MFNFIRIFECGTQQYSSQPQFFIKRTCCLLIAICSEYVHYKGSTCIFKFNTVWTKTNVCLAFTRVSCMCRLLNSMHQIYRNNVLYVDQRNKHNLIIICGRYDFFRLNLSSIGKNYIHHPPKHSVNMLSNILYTIYILNILKTNSHFVLS